MSNVNQLTIVMYHYVRPIKDSIYPGIKGLEFEGFKRQLDYLSSRYSLITAEQLIDYSKGGEDLSKNACFLTFDDGYKDHIEFVMPELLSRRIQGSFFPPADAVEKRVMLDVNAIHFILASTFDYKSLVNELNATCLEYGLNTADLNFLRDKWLVASRYDPPEIMYFKNMLQHALSKDIRSRIVSSLFRKYVGKTQIEFSEELYLSLSDTKELVNNGMYVGSHGCRHVWLDKESKSGQLDEINLSLKFLEKVGARTNDWIMCYPYGAYNDDTLNILKSNNCAIGLTTEVGFANLNKSKMLELSRFDTNDFPQ
ncbi:CDA1 Predicted xylanase/chitin deacetylase [Burkholderiaceae bacterium]